MNELLSPEVLGPVLTVLVVIAAMSFKFLKDQRNGLPVVKEKVRTLEENTEKQWKAIEETRNTVTGIDKKVERIAGHLMVDTSDI